MINAAYYTATGAQGGARIQRPRTHRFSVSDRIYVRLILNGHTLFEGVRTGIADLTSLLMMVRVEARRYKGLARMVVRNISQGWAVQRPLMLVPSKDVEEPVTPAHYTMPWQTH